MAIGTKDVVYIMHLKPLVTKSLGDVHYIYIPPSSDHTLSQCSDMR